jgi:hypothetical protein
MNSTAFGLIMPVRTLRSDFFFASLVQPFLDAFPIDAAVRERSLSRVEMRRSIQAEPRVPDAESRARILSASAF